MNISKFKSVAACSAMAIALLATARAEAFHHHRGGSCGSSGGSWGSSGGSWGSSGGSWGSSGGYTTSYGSWGSSGGSWGSSGGSSGYTVTYGSCGSCGGSWGGYTVPTMPAPAPGDQSMPTPPAAGDTAPPAATPPAAEGHDSAAQYQAGTSMLLVTVPADAKVTVNGRLTNSTGTERRFISRGLKSGARYSYEVQVEVIRDGQPVTEKKTAQLSVGKNADLAFSFSGKTNEQVAAAEPLRTTLVVNVPADAKVTLAGQDSKSSGTVREFITTKLAAGSEWSNYVVRAEIERDGKVVSKEETLSLKAGESRELTFNFGPDSSGKVAGTDAR